MALEALRKDRWEFVHTDVPMCPHCGADFDIDENEAWELYDVSTDEHEVTCSTCDAPFIVHTHAKYTFCTDNQPEADE